MAQLNVIRARLLLALCVVAVAPLVAPVTLATSQSVTRPAQASAPTPAPSAAQVDKLFESMDTPVSPGCALAVVQDGKITYSRGYGLANLEHGIRITPSTVFPANSISKQFTAASIVLLAQEGKLSLDDQVGKYIHELPDFHVPITIRQLLVHTSGLRDVFNVLELAGWRQVDLVTEQDVMDLIAHQKALNFPPGSRSLYSNTGYALLAQIVTRVSGQSFRDFTSARIFQPLGMSKTHFRDRHSEVVKDLAYGYGGSNPGFRVSDQHLETVGSTGLLSTVEDLALWDENFYRPRVGGPAMITQLLERGTLTNGEPLDRAFGLDLGTYRGLATVGHAGVGPGYRSEITRFPDQHFTAVCLCNLEAANPGALTRRVAEVYLANEMTAPNSPQGRDDPTVQLSESQLQNKVGLYMNADGLTRRVTFADGKLRIGDVEVRAVGENRFRRVGVPQSEAQADFIFETSATNEIKHLRAFRLLPFEPVPEATPSAEELKAYAGIYRSEEIVPLYEIRAEATALVLHRPKNGPDTLKPITRDVFRGDIGIVRFARDVKGQVAAMLVSTANALNLRFEKER